MEVKRLQELYKFNTWATAKMLDAVSRLTPEEFTKDLRNSFGSVRDTLVHVLSADWIWLERWRGISPKAMLSAADFPTIASLRARWMAIESQRAEFVSNVTQESAEKIITYVNTKGETWRYPLWQMLVHVVNHSTYHRGQVTTMLRQLGAEPAATDFLLFYDEGGGE
jgi:uncharacterized damage-inducible protein DinB